MDTMEAAVGQPAPELSHEARDACLHALGAMHASGTLSFPELEARIATALAAKTEGELAALVESCVEAPYQRQTADEPRAAVDRESRGPGAWLTTSRVLAVALTPLVALARLLARTALVLGGGVVRLLVVTARAGRFVCQALVLRSGASPARLQVRPSVSRELVLVPRPQVPARREPDKIHPVLVPGAAPASTALVLANRSTDIVLAGRATIRGEVLQRDLVCVVRTLPYGDHPTQGLVAQLRPLVERVTDRARWRRLTINARERAGRTRGWRRTIEPSLVPAPSQDALDAHRWSAR